MKVLVCGSRRMPWKLQELVFNTIRNLSTRPTLIIEGGARGADIYGKIAAIYLGIPWQEFPANWEKHGKKAGHIRNQQMLDAGPELVIAFHPSSGCTPGTLDMITRARNAGVPVQVVTYDEDQREVDPR